MFVAAGKEERWRKIGEMERERLNESLEKIEKMKMMGGGGMIMEKNVVGAE